MLLEKSRGASLIAAAIVVAFVVLSTLFSLSGCTSPTTRSSAADSSEIVLLSPKGGETFHVGDSLKITWKVQGSGLTDINAVDVELSPDNGKTWGLYLNSFSSIFTNSPQWENFSWKITNTFDKGGTIINLANDSQCLLRVEQYSTSDPNQRSVTKTQFTILP